MKESSERIMQQIAKFNIYIQNLFTSDLKRYNLTPSQLDVLMILWSGDNYILTDIAKKTLKDGPTITGIIDRLEDEKLIRRERTKEDRRVIRAVVTPKGHSLREKLLKMVKDQVEQTIEHADDKDIDVFERFLDAFSSVAESKEGEPK